MSPDFTRSLQVPRREELDLFTISNGSGLSISALPNGTLFAIEYVDDKGSVQINQTQGSPLIGGIGRLYLRIGGSNPGVVEIVGPHADGSFGWNATSFSWSGKTGDIAYDVRLELHPSETAWFWRGSFRHLKRGTLPVDLVLVQDVGLGDRGFLMNSEAYASQYIDHHIADHKAYGPVLMNRQNLKQPGARNPWLVQGCLNGAVAYATDAIQLVQAKHRQGELLVGPFGTSLPSERRQQEMACPAIQSKTFSVPASGATAGFFALFAADHAEASGDADLSRLDGIEPSGNTAADPEALAPVRSLLQGAPLLEAQALDKKAIGQLYPERSLEERAHGKLLSFFVPDGVLNRHVVLRDKELVVARRHGAIVRSGQNMLLDDTTLAATCWMQGIFAAQLTIGNTSFHKLFSVSRDPYNLTRASGLRILADLGAGWQLLAVPSAFEMGLSDCRWIYECPERRIIVTAVASGEDAAMQWSVSVEGEPCRFLVFGHVVLGEREYDAGGQIDFDPGRKRISFRPDPAWLWGERYPGAVYWLVSSTPDAIEEIGGDELLYADGVARNGAFVALRSRPTQALRFAVVGSMTDAEEAERLARRYEGGVSDEAMLAPASAFWRNTVRGMRIDSPSADLAAQATLLPWLAHDAIVHLSVPHGLEQYTGAAWGTRDACQGPIEFLLAYEHDREAREVVKTVFSEQYLERGDWPQWFMLEPYANIRAGDSHGDVIVWPLKALCDYIEATGDLAILDQEVSWRDEKTMQKTPHSDSIAIHVEKLLDTVGEQFIPGTHLIRYGEGDWNDSLQPADPHLRDWMVSSWTVALLYEQIVRYSAILRRIGHDDRAKALRKIATAMRRDFNRHLMRDGVVAGYGIFDPAHDGVELLLHPSDTRTGLSFSLISMTQAMLGKLFTPAQRRDHMRLIEEHLLFPDGVRLMEKPATYSGGLETLFRRAESSSFFGREIGLMYVHAHLRYCETLALDASAEELWKAIAVVNPIAVTTALPHASLRQRNTYFSSSDAAFHDRYQAAEQWARTKTGQIAVDCGWRIYSSGPGLYTRSFVENILGFKRRFGRRSRKPLLPAAHAAVALQTDHSAWRRLRKPKPKM
ncbi:cellobiose phosphorylase [Rhizobium bangladeshense]|uniref:Cellobiose phosphorylase n=1 Tax=Rhizobium bangladeshense TaxID=1138189 RepID=A0ABS7LGX7_9HYPH|nr:cellobiose phosphorylase [Rhizobium bangladeshense]MBX4868386.1 cellobiose phosphorylase [Rhizobium bangladeshense]MBX4875678.1 cellobiose phosphorylase [Rhizobium bangladeshense]MBX4886480.1 cellobiose phosphorylase [Rhizobium bangladeshense]MBX4894811.1 cellobiose phosphorylase [Rhizobium bangladeshense]MBX4903304.1 cellobiose phosphorylase [Rhizobium bangladeshense]